MLTSFDMALGAVVLLGVLMFVFVLSVARLTRQKPSAQIDMELDIPPAPAKPAKRGTRPLVGAGTR
jgi:hypothetical protein